MTKQKKQVLILLASLIAAALLMLALLPLLSGLAFSPQEPELPQINFADPSLSRDIESDADYMSLDRAIYYRTVDGYEIRTEIPEEAYSAQPEAVQMLISWLYAARRGDVSAYNACFSPEYIQKSGEQPAFTMQKIYNITITYHGRVSDSSVSGGYARTLLYSLSYCIKDNNGSLRKDMGSDVSREQYITVVEDAQGRAYVHGIRMYFPR